MTAFKTTFVVLAVMGGVWLTAIGAVLYSVNANDGRSKSLADGSIFMTVLALALIINVAIVAPGLLMLQPFRLWRVVRNERRAITPRQRFRGRLSPSFCGSSFLSIAFLPISHLLFAFSLTARRGPCDIEVDPYSDRPLIPISLAVYPGGYDPVYAMSCCILAIIFASAFALILPLVAPAVTLLLLLTLIGMFSFIEFPILIFVGS